MKRAPRRPETPARRLRRRLGFTQAAFAQLVGADLRSVIRWERDVEPSGAPAAVILALSIALDRAGRAESSMVKWLQQQAQLGGLANMLLTLLTERFDR